MGSVRKKINTINVEVASCHHGVQYSDIRDLSVYQTSLPTTKFLHKVHHRCCRNMHYGNAVTRNGIATKRHLNRIGTVMEKVLLKWVSGGVQSGCMAVISFKSNLSLTLLSCDVVQHVVPSENTLGNWLIAPSMYVYYRLSLWVQWPKNLSCCTLVRNLLENVKS